MVYNFCIYKFIEMICSYRRAAESERFLNFSNPNRLVGSQ